MAEVELIIDGSACLLVCFDEDEDSLRRTRFAGDTNKTKHFATSARKNIIHGPVHVYPVTNPLEAFAHPTKRVASGCGSGGRGEGKKAKVCCETARILRSCITIDDC